MRIQEILKIHCLDTVIFELHKIKQFFRHSSHFFLIEIDMDGMEKFCMKTKSDGKE